MQKLLLIDGNAILHRAYHAFPPLTNPKGEIINAVYGFFSMLLTVLADQKPDYLVVCFDKSKPTIRQALFAGYHEHRPKPADDFISQIGLVHELLAKMNVTMFALDGYEGDDLIGTITRKATQLSDRNQSSKHDRKTEQLTNQKLKTENRGQVTEVVILTGDRDMLQLVNDHVKVLMPLVGITKTVLFDPQSVEEKYGVMPSQFVDYKALIGDASDGYPGVTGIGPKTASKLIAEYGTFEDLYKHLGVLPEKIGIKLATDAEQAALAKKLATIITDTPIQFDLAQCAVADFDLTALREGFSMHGFKSLLGRLDGIFGGAMPEDAKAQELKGKIKKGEGEKSNEQLELLGK